MSITSRTCAVVCAAMTVCWSSGLFAAAIPYNAPGDVYTQNFDMLPNAPENTSLQDTNPWVQDVTLTDWQIWHSNFASPEGGADGHQRFRIGRGNSGTGSMYSFGSSGSTDRALGCVSSSVIGQGRWGTRFVNNTGITLTEFTLSYVGEQWRDGGAAGGSAAQTIVFGYSFDATDVGHGTFINVPELNFTSPVFGAASGVALDGNAAANRTLISFTVTGLEWLPGTELWIRWNDPDHDGNDHALAVDDLSFSAVPEPATLGLLGLAVAGLLIRRR
ncbi:MAG TPA: PEP-CTERM sorting domain-containing protein [Phycisphaerae bacterium]|nr:PEP-CTERM sorting domain-containing protein [Phycisphaerae bacterium]HOJ75540.1 PEP-CTERM sorting domain-containing protein [Phycisphaerae bacterium]HOM52823.1 PEP-CTERM sorting domain-containing protein [Phycisphaerae bacterium]HPP27939.1 PEP-CTERM sorting domain-containing protein [Phycisphaerae bacterium]HPU28215.1 PEP-CTERM sorting domain-containing protein [Phycisphaerae bacterium]